MFKKNKKRTKFVILAAVNITIFTIATMILSAYNKTVPDSLIVAFFSAWTVELALLFGIKLKDKD